MWSALFLFEDQKHQIEFDSFCQKVLMLGVKFQGSGYNELQHFAEILLVWISQIIISWILAWENSWHFAMPPLVSLGSASDCSCPKWNLLQPIKRTTQIREVTHRTHFSDAISQGNQGSIRLLQVQLLFSDPKTIAPLVKDLLNWPQCWHCKMLAVFSGYQIPASA